MLLIELESTLCCRRKETNLKFSTLNVLIALVAQCEESATISGLVMHCVVRHPRLFLDFYIVTAFDNVLSIVCS